MFVGFAFPIVSLTPFVVGFGMVRVESNYLGRGIDCLGVLTTLVLGHTPLAGIVCRLGATGASRQSDQERNRPDTTWNLHHLVEPKYA